MRELTVHDLDVELAEQLPARELMGGYSHGGFSMTNIAAAGNNNGFGSVYFFSGNQNQVFTAFSHNGNVAIAG